MAGVAKGRRVQCNEGSFLKDIISICLQKEQGFSVPAKVTISDKDWLDSDGLKSALEKNEV